MRSQTFKRIFVWLMAALLIELTVCQLSFWSTLTKTWQDVSAQTQIVYQYVAMEEMDSAFGGEETVYRDERGYLHVPAGSVLLRLEDLNCSVDRIHLDVDVPEWYQVKVTVFARDEGNAWLYQLGEGRVLIDGASENNWLKIYPYGKVKDLYIRLETADPEGNAAAGKMGDLVCNVNGISINGRMPFCVQPLRLAALAVICLLLGLLNEKCRLVHVPFETVGQKDDASSGAVQWKRGVAAAAFTALLLVLAAVFVRINPACQKNIALHHAQYQELAHSLAEGRTWVGVADERLLAVENPYDTINLQANQIPYLADYAYHDGKYYVYFGIVPELMLYLPWYLVTGQDMPNYYAVWFYFSGFIAASALLVYELMKRYFPKAPFFMYFVGTFMLTGSYSGFYLLIRPDLYHVPIAASLMFTTGGLGLYLAGLNRSRGRFLCFGAGSLCMALNAGCRPQFLLFLFPALLFVGTELWREKKKLGEIKPLKSLFLTKAGICQCLVLALPYFAAALGIMYYNAVRFGSPFDFGATYSMTSNDMTHRGFNLERVLYGVWYFLFQLPRLEGDFPWLRSADIVTDYLGKMVSESCFGGIFACSLLTWPVFLIGKFRKRLVEKGLLIFTAGAGLCALVICAADANGAGILQRYSTDISFGIFLAAVPMLFCLLEWAMEKNVYGAFLGALKAALILHLAFLLLVLVNTDSSVNLLRGNPQLYYKICALFRW